VLVAEDHESVRRILVALLRSEFDVVAAVGDGSELAKAAMLYRPDIIVSDIVMPVMSGLAAREALLSRKVDIPFVFVTLDAGLISPVSRTASYVHKADLTSELVQAVRIVAKGDFYISQTFRKLWGEPQ
jgi:DNA-binding NarL/FixJ family response regulator